MLQMTNLITDLAPYGIFFLAMQLTGTLGTEMLAVAVKFVVAIYVALLVIMLVFYPLVCKFMGRFSPIQFYKNVGPALIDGLQYRFFQCRSSYGLHLPGEALRRT